MKNRKRPVIASPAAGGKEILFYSITGAHAAGFHRASIHNALITGAVQLSHRWRYAETDPQLKIVPPPAEPYTPRKRGTPLGAVISTPNGGGMERLYPNKESLIEAGYSPKAVQAVCNGAAVISKGQLWRRAAPGDYPRLVEPFQPFRVRIDKPNRAIVGKNKSGQIVLLVSVHEAELKGFNHRLVRMCAQGKRKTHAGYSWRYA